MFIVIQSLTVLYYYWLYFQANLYLPYLCYELLYVLSLTLIVTYTLLIYRKKPNHLYSKLTYNRSLRAVDEFGEVSSIVRHHTEIYLYLELPFHLLRWEETGEPRRNYRNYRKFL